MLLPEPKLPVEERECGILLSPREVARELLVRETSAPESRIALTFMVFPRLEMDTIMVFEKVGEMLASSLGTSVSYLSTAREKEATVGSRESLWSRV